MYESRANYRLLSAALLAVALVVSFSHVAAAGESPSAAIPQSLAVYPPAVHLSESQATQSLVIQSIYADGITRDVTAEATFSLADAHIATLSGHTISPASNGNTTLTVRYGGKEATVDLTVVNAEKYRDLSFRNDVIPTLSKSGCNAGACHGASRGKDGFRLSLVGYDPKGDHHRLTKEISGRRINLAIPAESLLLEKATGKVPHTGGVAFKPGDQRYQTLLRWLELGAPNDSDTVRRSIGIELFPPSAVLQGKGEQHRLRVIASYDDGSRRDVTHLARFETGNEFSATIDENAVVTAHERGEAFLTAHFDEHTVGSHFIVLPAELDFVWPETPANNYIDTLVYDKLKKLRVSPSPLASDGEFLRRVSLDLIGRLPTSEEHQKFVANDDPSKREKVIDQLLERDEFVDIWVMKWAELLQMRTSPKIGRKSLMRYNGWLRDKIAGEVPLNEMAHDLLAASGGTFSNAATNYYQTEAETLKTAENAAQVFLGMRLQCAQCHNHLFDRWTMDDYYSFAAFFAQVGQKPGEDPRETIIYNKGQGEMKHLLDKRDMPPRFLGGDLAEAEGEDRRLVLARWMTSPDNPYFARHMANSIWAHFHGKGIVHPVDDVRVSNPPVNPQLLDELASRLVSYDFSLKRLVRDICNSRTYQLRSAPNETNVTDQRNFSHASLRRVPAPVLLDVISQITETTDKFKDEPEGTRAVQISDGATTNYFMTTFGRSARETACTCETRAEPNLSQALHLINGATVQQKIRGGKVVVTMLKDGKPATEIVDELYLRSLSRLPNEKERAAINEELDAAKTRKEKRALLEDIFWALLNSQEFLFNH